MPPEQLRARTRAFAVSVIRFYRRIPKTEEGRIIGRQLLKAGTSAGANYRAACRPKSDADFISKLGTAIEEVDESAFWMEVLVEAEVVNAAAVKDLYREADELTRIFVASRTTAQRNARIRALRRKRDRQN